MYTRKPKHVSSNKFINLVSILKDLNVLRKDSLILNWEGTVREVRYYSWQGSFRAWIDRCDIRTLAMADKMR